MDQSVKSMTINNKGDSLSNYVVYEYEEDGVRYGVAEHKHINYATPLSATGPSKKLVRGDGRYLLPLGYFGDAHIMHFQTEAQVRRQRREIMFRAGDIVVPSYPRSGTTWIEQVLLLILARGDASQLNTRNKNAYNPARPHALGKILVDAALHDANGGGDSGEQGESVDLGYPWGTLCGQDASYTASDIANMPKRRLFKTHVRPHLLAGMGVAEEELARGVPPPFSVPGVKFVCMIRDPKDVVVSLHRVNFLDCRRHGVPLTPYIKLFLAGKTLTAGLWSQYTREWLELGKQHPGDFLFLTYEENRDNPIDVVRRLSRFIDVQLTEDEVASCVRHSSFDVMKQLSKGAKAEHVHKGAVGDGAKHMNEEMIRAFNDMLSDPGLGSYGTRYMVPLSETDVESKYV